MSKREGGDLVDNLDIDRDRSSEKRFKRKLGSCVFFLKFFFLLTHIIYIAF